MSKELYEKAMIARDKSSLNGDEGDYYARKYREYKAELLRRLEAGDRAAGQNKSHIQGIINLENQIKYLKSERNRAVELVESLKEICICAAIKDTTGHIWRGHRHHDCMSSCEAAGRTFKVSEQGFVTSRNRYVDRYEGYKLQIAAGILSSSGSYRNERLFSEDLYCDNDKPDGEEGK